MKTESELADGMVVIVMSAVVVGAVGVWAVTRAVPDDTHCVITHVPTGRRVTTYISEKEALARLKVLSKSEYRTWQSKARLGDSPQNPPAGLVSILRGES